MKISKLFLLFLLFLLFPEKETYALGKNSRFIGHAAQEIEIHKPHITFNIFKIIGTGVIQVPSRYEENTEAQTHSNNKQNKRLYTDHFLTSLIQSWKSSNKSLLRCSANTLLLSKRLYIHYRVILV